MENVWKLERIGNWIFKAYILKIYCINVIMIPDCFWFKMNLYLAHFYAMNFTWHQYSSITKPGVFNIRLSMEVIRSSFIFNASVNILSFYLIVNIINNIMEQRHRKWKLFRNLDCNWIYGNNLHFSTGS